MSNDTNQFMLKCATGQLQEGFRGAFGRTGKVRFDDP